MNMYVGNLASDVTEDDLKQTFETYGEVTSVKIIKDLFSGTSKGFAFVEMPGKDQAKNAMTELNGKDLNGNPMRVDEARPRKDQRHHTKGRNRRY